MMILNGQLFLLYDYCIIFLRHFPEIDTDKTPADCRVPLLAAIAHIPVLGEVWTPAILHRLRIPLSFPSHIVLHLHSLLTQCHVKNILSQSEKMKMWSHWFWIPGEASQMWPDPRVFCFTELIHPVDHVAMRLLCHLSSIYWKYLPTYNCLIRNVCYYKRKKCVSKLHYSI